MTIAELRVEYTKAGLTEADAGLDPIEFFGRWFHEAMKAGVPEPNAMTLATATPNGRPSARIVLLKVYDRAGFCFFTNYRSRKARDLVANPNAALTFFWPELERQVRIEGYVSHTAAEESDAYFAARPRMSQLGAWASPQSDVINDRAFLEAEMSRLEAKFPNQVPRPTHWGGFRLSPSVVEFWQGRPNRLHDRLRYTLADGQWHRERLGP